MDALIGFLVHDEVYPYAQEEQEEDNECDDAADVLTLTVLGRTIANVTGCFDELLLVLLRVGKLGSRWSCTHFARILDNIVDMGNQKWAKYVVYEQ